MNETRKFFTMYTRVQVYTRVTRVYTCTHVYTRAHDEIFACFGRNFYENNFLDFLSSKNIETRYDKNCVHACNTCTRVSTRV